MDGFWIDDRIYCTLVTTCYYNSQATLCPLLLSILFETAVSRDFLSSSSHLPEIVVIYPRGGPHRKHHLLYCCVLIYCCRDMSTAPLHSNERGADIQKTSPFYCCWRSLPRDCLPSRCLTMNCSDFRRHVTTF
jgi:hypothetical protein